MAATGHVEPVGPGAVDDRFALGTCRYTGVLTRRQVCAFVEAARKKVAGVHRLQHTQPFPECSPGLFGVFKLDRSSGFSLYDGCSIANPAAKANVLGLKGDEITSAKLAVDRQIEECEITL
jgi:hypothetical protein